MNYINCFLGLYGNRDTNLCESCPENCEFCLSSDLADCISFVFIVQ